MKTELSATYRGGPAFPTSLENKSSDPIMGFMGEHIRPGDSHEYSGVTIRDWLAVHLDSSLFWPTDAAEQIVGRPAPEDDAVANAVFWAEFRAHMRYIEADAMYRIANLTTSGENHEH